MTTQQQLVPIGMKPNQGARERLGGISRTTIYELIKRGELVHVSIGRRGFVTAESLNAFVERLTAASQSAGAA